MQPYPANKHEKIEFEPKMKNFIAQLLLTKQKINIPKKQFFSQVQTLNKALQKFNLFPCANEIEQILNSKNKLQQTISIADFVIDRILALNLNPIFLSAYINCIKNHKDCLNKNVNVDRDKLINLIERIDIKTIVFFCQAFDLFIPNNMLIKIIGHLLNKDQTANVLRLISRQQDKKPLFQIIARYAIKKQDKPTVDNLIKQIVKYGFKKNDFKQLHEAALRLQFREIYEGHTQSHVKNYVGFQYAQEVFSIYPAIMKLLLRRLQKEGNKKNILQLCSRNHYLIQLISNKYLQQQIRKEIEKLGGHIKSSIHSDKFQPSDMKQYFHLQNFGIKEKDVIFLNAQSPDLQACLQEIANSNILGLDTESYVARSGFSDTLELLSTIQISNGIKAYIFDAKNINSKIIGQKLRNFFCNKNKTLVGHTLRQDLQATLKALGINQKESCRTIDVKQDFKSIFPGKGASLKNISLIVLGKEICKKYTVTNWGRRPLYRNQLHYAALDAVIVLQIHKKLQQLKKQMK